MEPFNPREFRCFYSERQTEKDIDACLPVVDDSGRLELEPSEQFCPPLEKKHRSFNRSVQLYLNREKELFNKAELVGVRRHPQENRDDFLHAGSRTMKEWYSRSVALTDESMSLIHCAEAELVKAIMNHASEDEIRQAVLSLIKQFCLCTRERDTGDWLRHLDDFMEKEMADVRISCALHLMPEKERPYHYQLSGVGGSQRAVVVSECLADFGEQLTQMDSVIAQFRKDRPDFVLKNLENREAQRQQHAPQSGDLGPESGIASRLLSLKQQLLDAGTPMVDDNFFEFLVKNVDSEKLLSDEPLTLAQKLWCFNTLLQWGEKGKRIGVAASRGWVELHEIVTVLNSDLLVVQDYVTLQNETATSSRAVIARVVAQTPDPDMVGFGLTSWGNTCHFNMLLQMLVRAIPIHVLESMAQQHYDDPDQQALCRSFSNFAREAKAILSGRLSPRVMTNRQVHFFRACQQYARAGKFVGVGNDVFRVDGIEKLCQKDAGDLVNSLMFALGVSDHPALAFQQQRVDVASFQGKRIMRPVDEQSPPEAVPFANMFPNARVGQLPADITVRDWLNAALECPLTNRNGEQLWQVKDLPPGCRQARRLHSHSEYVQRVDTRHFSTLSLMFSVTGVDELCQCARTALVNSGLELDCPVLDENNQFRLAKMRLKTLGLHASTAKRYSTGHYVQASFDEQGNCSIQDDFRSLPFKSYARFMEMDGAVSANGVWKSLNDMITKGQYTPTVCVYELVGYDSLPEQNDGSDVSGNIGVTQKEELTMPSTDRSVETIFPQRESLRVPKAQSISEVLEQIRPDEPVLVCFDLDDTLVTKDIVDGVQRRVLVNSDTSEVIQQIRLKAGRGNARIILLTANDEETVARKLRESGLDSKLFDATVCVKVQTGPLKSKGQGVRHDLQQSGHPARHVVIVDDVSGMLESVEQASREMKIPCTAFHFAGAKPQIYHMDYQAQREMIPDISFERFVQIQQLANDKDWNSEDVKAVYINESAVMRQVFDQMSTYNLSYAWRSLTLPPSYQQPPHLGQPVIKHRVC